MPLPSVTGTWVIFRANPRHTLNTLQTSSTSPGDVSSTDTSSTRSPTYWDVPWPPFPTSAIATPPSGTAFTNQVSTSPGNNSSTPTMSITKLLRRRFDCCILRPLTVTVASKCVCQPKRSYRIGWLDCGTCSCWWPPRDIDSLPYSTIPASYPSPSNFEAFDPSSSISEGGRLVTAWRGWWLNEDGITVGSTEHGHRCRRLWK